MIYNKLFEGAPSINNSLDYWLSRGKSGKNCMIYFHDDLDGIMSCIVTRDYLLNKGFNIAGYGIVNYQDGWKNIHLNNEYINIALDYAEDIEGLDIYIDHHGSFVDDGGDIEKKNVKSKKTSTNSAYEGICYQLGLTTDSTILDVIDMIDGARYEFYGVDIETILNFNLNDIIKNKNSKLIFAGAFNQLIKRSDYKTLIEVAHNATLSIINIFLMFKKLYPANNLNWRSGELLDFVSDGKNRVKMMINKVRGNKKKNIYLSQKDFWGDFWNGNNLILDGYQIIGNLAFVPNGTWANALRAKAIINEDLRNKIELKNHTVDFILLQYGGSLQIADLNGINNIPEEKLPVLKSGKIVNDLGDYTNELLSSFRLHLDYDKSITKSGGHKGIGNISNILGVCDIGEYRNIKWVDIFKNKIINDLSGVKWSIRMLWDRKIDMENKYGGKNINRVLMVDKLRKIS